ncbi:DUF1415 domain-containing protein [soil metagenome]
MNGMDDANAVITVTRRWLETMVIGLNLCPFARRVYEAQRIRYFVSEAINEEKLRADLARELTALHETPRTQVETSLLIHPRVLVDFLEYNDFLAVAEETLHDLDMVGTIQIASFHPQYQFAGTSIEDVENTTNRSPFPMLHLLREVSVTEVAENAEFLAGIPARNMTLMRHLGQQQILDMLRKIQAG